MSTDLPGNPFTLIKMSGTPAEAAIVSASYAVAYEQRTANLIALLNTDSDTLPWDVNWAAVRRQVIERLGLNEEGQ